jgi:GAF domain-containing protein
MAGQMDVVESPSERSEVLFYSAASRPEDEAARQNAVLTSGALRCRGDERLFALAQKAAATVGTSMAAISVIEGDAHHFLATAGFEGQNLPRSISLCAHTIQSAAGSLWISDLVADQRFAGNPLVLSAPYLRSYAGVAVRGPEGHRIGALCALDVETITIQSGRARSDLIGLAGAVEAILAAA